MTDNEIIKAMECCINWGGVHSCANCPLHDTGCIHFNKLQETLDLINRQKAEIEENQKKFAEILKLTQETEELLSTEFAKAKAEAIKEFAERLKTEYAKGMN